MAGPVACIRFASIAALSWRTEIERIINLVCSERDGISVQVVNTLQIGGSYSGSGRPFLINSDDKEPWYEPAEMEATMVLHERVFGFRPDSAINVSAMSKQNEDHRILGELSVAMAERLNGVIDMCGLIALHRTLLPAIDPWDASWSDVQDRVQAFTDAMPGRTAAFPYMTSSGREWASHTVDPTFLRSWLVHPAFRMVE